MKKRIINVTDERIVIEPGQALDIEAEKEVRRVMSSRREIMFIKGVKEAGFLKDGPDRPEE